MERQPDCGGVRHRANLGQQLAARVDLRCRRSQVGLAWQQRVGKPVAADALLNKV